MKKKRNGKKRMGEQVAFRLPTDLRKFYEREAEEKNVLLSVALRNALAERANQLREPEVQPA